MTSVILRFSFQVLVSTAILATLIHLALFWFIFRQQQHQDDSAFSTALASHSFKKEQENPTFDRWEKIIEDSEDSLPFWIAVWISGGTLLVRLVVLPRLLFLTYVVYLGSCLAEGIWKRIVASIWNNDRGRVRNIPNTVEVCLGIFFLAQGSWIALVCLGVALPVGVLFFGNAVCPGLQCVGLYQIYFQWSHHSTVMALFLSTYLAIRLHCLSILASPLQYSAAEADNPVAMLEYPQDYGRKLILLSGQSIVEAAFLLYLFSVGCSRGKCYMMDDISRRNVTSTSTATSTSTSTTSSKLKKD